MDRNVILAFALSMAVFSGWLAWQERVHGPERRAALERQQAAEAAARQVEATEPTQAPQVVAESPHIAKESSPELMPPGSSAKDTPQIAPWSGSIENELAAGEFTNRGGTLTGWRLKQYFETPRQEANVQLIALPPPHSLALSTPFEELGFGDLSEAMYEVEYESSDQIVFALRRGDVVIRKTYRAGDIDYTFRLEVEIDNQSDRVLTSQFRIDWPAAANDRQDFKELGLLALGEGDVSRELVRTIGSPGFMSRIFGNGDEGPTKLSLDVRWGGIDLRYFVGLLIPQDAEAIEVVLAPLDRGKSAVMQMSQRSAQVSPGQKLARHFDVYIGPKQPALLASVGQQADLAISRGYSWVAPLTTFFGWALHSTYSVVPNYGLAIILITVLVRLATWPIMARQMKSAERMRELMPRIKELQEKHKDDKQKQSEETFKLYRETGVNPLGGCLPMVLQLPVFIGLFYALQSSIDLRHAPFVFWINDLSAPATLFTIPGVGFPVRLLPLVMGASMYAQQKMMPQAGADPAQAKMMLIMMPGMMLFISYSFPSGLVLYWMVSNLLGIAHQLLVRRKMSHAAAT